MYYRCSYMPKAENMREREKGRKKRDTNTETGKTEERGVVKNKEHMKGKQT